jgi:hypothetical protein
VSGFTGLMCCLRRESSPAWSLALAGELSRETVLREALDGLGYEAILIDTSSSRGLLTVNALVAADVVVAPVAADDESAAQGRGASGDDREAGTDPVCCPSCP